MARIEAAVVAEDAGTDVFLLTVHKLGNPLLVCKERTGKACAVKFTGFD